MKKLWLIILIVLYYTFPLRAYAGNGISGITVQVTRSLHSVGIKAIVSGDDDSSAVCRIFQAKTRGESPDSGMAMVRRTGSNIHEGRILWMTPGQTVYYQVRAVDASGGWTTPLDSVSCAQVRPMVATGTVIYVNKNGGSDSNNGLTPGAAKLTIGGVSGGLAALAASTDSGAFGGVIVAPGEYHERVSLNFGTDGKPRFLMGDGTNRDSTILCGANEQVEAGNYAAASPLSWSLRPPTTTTVSYIYKTYFPATTGPGDSTWNVVLGWGEQLHHKTTLAAMAADSTGESSAWFWQSDTLFVKRKNQLTPAGSTLHTGYRDELIQVNRKNWRISRLTMRFAGGTLTGTASAAYPDPPVDGHGVIAPATVATANGMVVDSCRFYGNNGFSVYARWVSATLRSDSCTVSNCIADGLTIGSMPYDAAKNRMEEDMGTIKLTGSCSNVFNNLISETHNGIQTGPTAGTTDSLMAYGAEIYGNNISRLSDDAIELDTGHGINELVMNNSTDYTGSGISISPVYTGPVFCFWNTLLRFKSAGLKIGGGNTAVGLFNQNTIVSKESASRAFEGISGGAIAAGTGIDFRNNIWLGGSITIAGPSIADSLGSSAARFNYDIVDSVSTGRLLKWHDSYFTWSLWKSYTNNDANSTQGTPNYALELPNNPGTPLAIVDARLKNSTGAYPSNVANKAGRIMRGINDGLLGKRYASQPFIGSKGCYDCYYQDP